MSWTCHGKKVNHASDDIEKNHFIFPWKILKDSQDAKKIKSFFYNPLY